MRYVVLLRGVNVGGRNKVPMAELRDRLASSVANVQTYIQSGNIMFDTELDAVEVAAFVERELADAFAVDTDLIRALVFDVATYRAVVSGAPTGFGSQPDRYRYDVWFYLGVNARDVRPHLSVHPDVDDVHTGEHALYHRRLTSLAARSRVARHLLGSPVYESLTVRNWRTTLAVAELLTA